MFGQTPFRGEREKIKYLSRKKPHFARFYALSLTDISTTDAKPINVCIIVYIPIYSLTSFPLSPETPPLPEQLNPLYSNKPDNTFA